MDDHVSRALRRYEELSGEPADLGAIDYHTVRFGLVTPLSTANLVAHPPPARVPQRFIQVTHAVTIKTDRFVFAAPYTGMETIAKAGTVIAHDGDEPVATPYDDCVLVMPGPHRYRKPGLTAVRLGRVIEAPAAE